MKKQPQVTEQTKANLRNAFWSLYSQKPIEKITIKEITDLAGYNRGTFYLYYKDVYDILNQIEEELLDLVCQLLSDATTDGTLDLSHQMTSLIEMSHTYSNYVSVLISDQGDPQFTARMKNIIRPVINEVLFSSKNLQYTEAEKIYLSEFYLSGILGVMSEWLKDPQMSIEEMLNFLLPVLFNSN